MSTIEVRHDPEKSELESMGVFNWPIWDHHPATFGWGYGGTETCYILEGRVVVTPEDGDPVEITAGDLVVFHPGLNCTWDVREHVRKHYISE